MGLIVPCKIFPRLGWMWRIFHIKCQSHNTLLWIWIMLSPPPEYLQLTMQLLRVTITLKYSMLIWSYNYNIATHSNANENSLQCMYSNGTRHSFKIWTWLNFSICVKILFKKNWTWLPRTYGWICWCNCNIFKIMGERLILCDLLNVEYWNMMIELY